MPLVLLLGRVTGAFEKGMQQMQRWTALTLLEEALVQRARSLFAVRWFGRAVPVLGRHLHIAIGNLDALRAQYAVVQAQRQAQPVLSLTEPMAGLTGAMLGAVISPTGLAVGSGFVLVRLTSVVAGLWFALLVSASGLLGLTLSPVFIGLGLPLLLLAVPALAGTAHARVLSRFFRALAAALDAMNGFLEQLLGPRAGVRNPLVRRLLELGDRLAHLIPQAVGATAFLVVRGTEVLRPLLDQLLPLYRFTRAVIEAVAFLIADTGLRLGRLLYGPRSLRQVLNLVLDRLLLIVAITRGVLEIVPQDILRRLQWWWQGTQAWEGSSGDPGVLGRLGAWRDLTKEVFLGRMRIHPLWDAFEQAEARFAVIGGVWTSASARAARIAAATPPSNDFFDRFLAEFEAGLRPSLDALDRRVPDIGAFLANPWAGAALLPETAAVARAAGGWPTPITAAEIERRRRRFARARERFQGLLPDVLRPLVQPFFLSDSATQAVTRARRPPSIFARERRRVDEALQRPLSAEAQRLRGEERTLRQALAAVVAEVLPESLSVYLVELDDLLREDEARAAGQREVPPRELPVREILDSRRLQPVVRALRVRARGFSRLNADAWADALRIRLGEQAYLAAE
ncbi:MAG: hypothetical protein HKN04_09455 [Rhodothermaceae bacterium]|nr:hypothetical protein [Rhodothermaceae bacterium]